MYKHWNQAIVNFDGSPLLWIHGYREDWEQSIHGHLSAVLNSCNTRFYIGIIDGGNNFRNEIATKKEYKGNRIQEKPPYFYQLKKLLIEKYKFIVVKGVEADDLLGICQCAISKPFIKIPFDGQLKNIQTVKPLSYIASIDKDLRTINGFHYDLKKHTKSQVSDESSFIKLSDDKKKLTGQGYMFYYAQILIGDTTDNIPGLPKCGPVKAFKILSECSTREECEHAVLQAYTEHYGTTGEKEMNEQKVLVKILTWHHKVPRIIIQNFNNTRTNFNNLTLF